MLELIINGETRLFENVTTLTTLIDLLDLQGKRIAIELNGEIIPRSQHGQTMLTNRDALEIVVAVGGG